jgi:hypothetical protein
MNNLLTYLKTHKLVVFLILVITYFWGNSLLSSFFGIGVSNYGISRQMTGSYGAADMVAESALPAQAGMGAPSAFKSSGLSILPPVEPDYSPQPGISDRLVVQESNLSLVVENVRQAVNQILDYATRTSGYMVSSSLNRPEDAPYATVVVRVPSERLDEVLEHYRQLAIKVSSENLYGHDVTDEYLDINTRLERLRRTQVKFEQLLDQAVKFEDILRAQQEIFNLQDQIDNLIGRQQYLEQTSKLARLTIHLSTDELALPYTPSETFRPAVVFKLAVRSLLQSLQNLAGKAIWLAVYSIIWIPVLLLFFLIRHWWQRRNKPSS